MDSSNSTVQRDFAVSEAMQDAFIMRIFAPAFDNVIQSVFVRKPRRHAQPVRDLMSKKAEFVSSIDFAPAMIPFPDAKRSAVQLPWILYIRPGNWSGS